MTEMMQKKIDELEKRNDRALAGGGPEKLAKQKMGGRLSARERVEVLLDPGSFTEMDRFVTHRCTNFGMEKSKPFGDGIITGYGRINGKLVMYLRRTLQLRADQCRALRQIKFAR